MGNPTSYLGATLTWQGKQKTAGGTLFYTTYYYLRNAQGDVVKLIDGSGSIVVEYAYDSWGKKLSTTGTLATTLGKYQPFRYRSYVYDTETGFYYLQSRYYDPAIGRFISADVYLSTGQGVIGHNAFAYCLNNSVNGHDTDGHIFRPYSVMMADNGMGNAAYYASVLLRRSGLYDNPNLPYATDDVDVVIRRGKLGYDSTVYNGVKVCYFNPKETVFKASFTPGPCILLATDDLNADTINHEYGHILQLRMLGVRYYTKIGLPSLIGSVLSNYNAYIYQHYSSLPCERSADLFGNVTDNLYIRGDDIVSIIYLFIP